MRRQKGAGVDRWRGVTRAGGMRVGVRWASAAAAAVLLPVRGAEALYSDGATLTSTSFNDGCEYPAGFSGIDGTTPDLAWTAATAGVAEFAVLMYHYPNSADEGDLTRANIYWIVWGIPSTATGLASATSPGECDATGCYVGANKDGDSAAYTPPNSPYVSCGCHAENQKDYGIRLYALTASPDLGTADSTAVDGAAFLAAVESVTESYVDLEFHHTATGTDTETCASTCDDDDDDDASCTASDDDDDDDDDDVDSGVGVLAGFAVVTSVAATSLLIG